MENLQTAVPAGFNNADWKLYKGNKDHVRFLPKCIALFWLIFEGQQLTGEAFFQQEWAANKLGITVRHLQNLIAELKTAGLILIDRREQNYYKVVEFFSRPPGDWVQAAKQKVKAVLESFYGAFQQQFNGQSAQGQNPKPKKQTPAQKDKAKAQAIAKTVIQAQETKSQEAAAEEKTQEQLEKEETRKQEILAELAAKAEAEYQATKSIRRTGEELYALIDKLAKELIATYTSKPSHFTLAGAISNKLREHRVSSKEINDFSGWIYNVAYDVVNKHFSGSSPSR